MGGRHAGDKDPSGRGGIMVGLGIVALAAVLAIAFVVRDDERSASADCGGGDPFVVAVAPEIEPIVAAAAARAGADHCLSYDVVAEAPALTAQAVTIGDDTADLWVPDSSVWLSRVSTQLVEGVAEPRTVVRSVASSPVIVAWPKEGGEAPRTWLALLTTPSFTAGDPLASATGAAPLLAAYAEAARGVTPTAFSTVSAAQVTLAQRQAGSPPPVDPTALLTAVARTGGSTVVSEQAFNAAGEAAASFDPIVPQSGSLGLGYPLASVTDRPGISKAASELGDALTAKASAEAFADAGFRSPLGDPLSTGRSVGAIAPMAIKDPKVVADTIRRWSLIAMPGRTLAVVDVSKPMNGRVGGSTKMALTIQAALKGLGLMPNSWSLGSWALAAKNGSKKNWTELAPIRRLDSASGTSTHRARIVSATSRLNKQVGGKTSLYDTTLAAYRAVQASYDPKAVNSVIILTGGRNDDPGSISEAKLLEALKRERDPARPVVVIAIGITKDADAFTLQKIAQATGGQVYLAREPDEIVDVFINALQARY
ncbi:VWA domain-containing protein [Mumia zhuanghuii]|uniref:VWA domain-containing protein n=1 Tax=Mumia zhuanghuii TaxID=2585211 RepID=A0A5Q6RWI8_9ACTN|nr:MULTISPECIES: VWA domain-containing protein [Mumia]KAA1422397.1 VWA domain-containing protein [Mumia zhuanghuii]